MARQRQGGVRPRAAPAVFEEVAVLLLEGLVVRGFRLGIALRVIGGKGEGVIAEEDKDGDAQFPGEVILYLRVAALVSLVVLPRGRTEAFSSEMDDEVAGLHFLPEFFHQRRGCGGSKVILEHRVASEIQEGIAQDEASLPEIATAGMSRGMARQ